MENVALNFNPAFWQNKRVLLTGHTGFKGSWLSLWLQSMGAQVAGYALAPSSQPNLFELAQVGKGMASHVIGDIRDLSAVQQAFTAFQPEIVFHLAAQPLVRHSYQDPVTTYATNVMGTVHVLEAIRHAPGVKTVVNITTDKCYENREWIWDYRENDPMGGHDPYSNSKACAELVSAAYRSSFFNVDKHQIALATVRAGNVIGGGDWAQDRLIPDILAAFEQGKMLHIRNPHAIRPWQHVLEPLRGYLMLAQQLTEHGTQYAESWNFGPRDEDAKPVNWIVEQMAAIWRQHDDSQNNENHKNIQWQIDTAAHPHEAGHLKLNITKARSLLGWHPALSLQEALQLTVAWARQHQAGADMRQVTLEQIQAYQALIHAQH